MTIVLIFLFLFLMHVLALATNDIFVPILSAFILLKHDLLFSEASYSSSLAPAPTLLHLHSKCFQEASWRINDIFLCLSPVECGVRGEDFWVLCPVRSCLSSINLKTEVFI